MELDPSRAIDEASDFEANTLQLQLITQKVFKAVINSDASIPVDLKLFFQKLAQVDQSFKFVTFCRVSSKCIQQTPELSLRRVLELFSSCVLSFQQLLCPVSCCCIRKFTGTDIYGLLEAPPNENTQRSLILLGKMLQNISNGTLPGNKEEYMLSSNSKKTLHSYL